MRKLHFISLALPLFFIFVGVGVFLAMLIMAYAHNSFAPLILTPFIIFFIFSSLKIFTHQRETLRNLHFPDILIASDEEVLIHLTNARVEATTFLSPIFYGKSIAEHDVIITNKKILLPANFFGKYQFLPESFLPFLGATYEEKQLCGLWGVIQKIELEQNGQSRLLITMDRSHGQYTIYSKNAKLAYDLLLLKRSL